MPYVQNNGAALRLGDRTRILRGGGWVDDRYANRGEIFLATDEQYTRFRYKLQMVNPRTLPDDPEHPGATGPDAESVRVEEGDAEPPKDTRHTPEPTDSPKKVMKSGGVVSPDEVPEYEDADAYHTGNGWYTLPGGERVHGRKKAEKRLEEMKDGAG